jgi:hypothetical protein
MHKLIQQKSLWIIPVLLHLLSYIALTAQETTRIKPGIHTFEVTVDYLKNREDIPGFWLTTNEEVSAFLTSHIKKGAISQIGTSAGGRPLYAVSYGKPREGKGTSTFSGSLGYRDVAAYRGPDHEKTVFMAMAGVHGGELEPIMGIINFLSVLETGRDLRGKEWPDFKPLLDSIDRLIVIPVMNPDGRNRVPIRMAPHRGMDHTVIEYWNTGGDPDGTITGWPHVKKHIPFDFTTNKFPGGYPNEAGVNIQHDDFFDQIQPETRALYDLCSREKPDLILNMHTGAVFPKIHRPFTEPDLDAPFEQLYRGVLTAWTKAGLERTNDPDTEANPERAVRSPYNLDTALSLHCGALAVVFESPSHGFSAARTENGDMIILTPEMLLDAQLIAYRESMRFLATTGGRSKWTPSGN